MVTRRMSPNIDNMKLSWGKCVSMVVGGCGCSYDMFAATTITYACSLVVHKTYVSLIYICSFVWLYCVTVKILCMSMLWSFDLINLKNILPFLSLSISFSFFFQRQWTPSAFLTNHNKNKIMRCIHGISDCPATFSALWMPYANLTSSVTMATSVKSSCKS